MNTFLSYFVLVAVILVVGSFAVAIPMLVDELSKARDRRQFRSALAKAVAGGAVSWKQVRALADRYHLTQRGLLISLTRLIADSLEGAEGLTHQQAASFEIYFDQVQRDEPFDGIPNDVRFHLERVRERLGESDDLLRPLAKQLQDLSTRNRAKERNMWFVSVLGLLVGLVGAILGALPLMDEKPKEIQPVAGSALVQPVGKTKNKQELGTVKELGSQFAQDHGKAQ